MDILRYDRDIFSTFVYDGHEKEYTGPDVRQMVEFYANMGDCWMGIHEGKVLGAGGVYALWEGTGSAWLFVNREAAAHKVSIFKAMLEKLTESVHKYGIRTMHVSCVDGILEANTLIRHLGFTKSQETKMATYFREVK